MVDPLKVVLDGKRIMRPGDRLFEPVYNFLIILASISYAASALAGSKSHRSPNPVMRAQTRWPNYGLAIPLGNVMTNALMATPPRSIEIGIMTNPVLLSTPLPDAKLQTAGLHSPINFATGPIFLGFFERFNDWLTATYGDAVNWPPTLNFARIVRNSAAHGKIHIRSPGAPAAHWRDLSYTHADNGRKVIGDDIKFPEVLALMFDCDDELNALNAPIL